MPERLPTVDSPTAKGPGDVTPASPTSRTRSLFRDPDLTSLQIEVARILVGAPTLPIDLPRFDLTLLSVAVLGKAIDLLVGKSSPIAKLRLSPNSNASSPAVEVRIVEMHPAAARFGEKLETMRKRLETAISLEKWTLAHDRGAELGDLPIDVPLSFFRQLVPGVGQQGLIRTGFRCNQDCGICWQDRDWGTYSSSQILTWIEDLHAAGARGLIISGGEPTLDHELEAYIRRAKELRFTSITLETNAIQFVKPGLAEKLRSAGLGECFVSLHSGDAATSDEITRAPGTFARTIAGIKVLLATGISVRLNCVMTGEGVEHLSGMPDFIHDTFANHPKLQGIMFSQPTDPYDRSLLPSIVPEPSRLREALRQAIDRAFALGIKVSGLDGPCGPPLCAFGADRRITSLRKINETLDGRTYLAPCQQCAVRDACFGVRNADAELYGESCVLPFHEAPSAA